MNTDKVIRGKFEAEMGIEMLMYDWSGKKDKYVHCVGENDVRFNDIYLMFKTGYQQATKESEAEIEKLAGHITYLRDEIADREARIDELVIGQ